MNQRVWQFWQALRANMHPEDHALVQKYLNEQEQALFYAMHRVDQVHAVRVARTAAALAESAEAEGKLVKQSFLLRCALLHDVGRVKGDLDLMGKVWAVLARHYLPHWSRRMADSRRVHLLYVYYHHAAIGATKLRQIGDHDVAELIVRHHDAAGANDSIELKILRAADEAN